MSSPQQQAGNNAQAQTLQMVADLEIEMMTDMYRRMTKCCQDKCINTHYREPDLTKG
jgi:import inner membrane translocase subunit TIM10